MKYLGGCCCGALKYESNSAPVVCGYCHCRTCQKTSAAPALVFASFPVDDFNYASGIPTIFRSSDRGNREFCSLCGTQIAFRESNGATTVDVNVGSLDDPSITVPDHHIWCRSQIQWFETSDSLPRYQKGRPDAA